MRNSDYIELYQKVVKLESDMEGNESIESWKSSIGKIKTDLFETSFAYKIVQPSMLIYTADGTVAFSFEGYDLIVETLSVISVMLISIEHIIELNCSDDIAPPFMDYEYGGLCSLICTLKEQIKYKLNTLLGTKIIGMYVTKVGEYVYTTYENPSWFYDVNTKEYVGRLVEVNGVYEAILNQNNKIIEFKSVM